MASKDIGRNVSVFYDDGNSVSKKIGKLLLIDDNFIIISTIKENISIPIPRIIRIETDNHNK